MRYTPWAGSGIGPAARDLDLLLLLLLLPLLARRSRVATELDCGRLLLVPAFSGEFVGDNDTGLIGGRGGGGGEGGGGGAPAIKRSLNTPPS